MKTIAMQSRCLNCLREQYALAVYSVSKGESPCVWCGEYSKPLSEKQYQKVLKDKRNNG